MKKIFTILLACSSYTLFAQHAEFTRISNDHSRNREKQPVTDNTTWYGRVGVGYAFTQAGQVNSLLGTPYSGSSTFDAAGQMETSFNYKKASMNAGVNATIAAGRMFGPHVGLELAAQFNVAPAKYTFNGQNIPISGGGLIDIKTVNQAKFPIFLIPAVVFQTQIHNMLEGYGRLGIVLPLDTKVNTNISSDGQPVYTSVQSAKFNLGFSGALGLKYALRNGLKLWGEFNVMSLSAYTKKEVVTYTSGQTITQTFSLKGSNPSSSPTGARSTSSVPFSNAGVLVGISMSL